MQRIIQRTILLSMLAMTLVSCTSQSGKGEVMIDEKDAGSSIALKAGDVLFITLEGNPTTGYIWEPSPESTGILAQLGEWEFKADSGLIGSGGRVTLKMQASQPGEGKLILIYHRTFEKDVPPLKTYEVNIIVKD